MVRDYENSDLPSWIKWLMTFINRIGFPIAVAIYLGYMQLQMMPRLENALQKVESAVRENTEVLRTWRHP